MKQVLLGTVAGLASAASAQSASLSIIASTYTIDCSTTALFTLSVYASADFGTHIAGGEFALNGSGDASQAISMEASAASWGAGFENDRGYDGNGNHLGLVFGQIIFPPVLQPSPESALGNGPVLLGTIEVLVPQGGLGWYQWDTAMGVGDFILEVFDENTNSFTQLTSVEHGSTSILVCPSPSGVGVLALAGLVGVRRRR